MASSAQSTAQLGTYANFLGGDALRGLLFNSVAAKELKLSYYVGETLLFTIYAHYGNFI